MDLQKTAGDTVDGIVSTIKFIGVYFRDSMLVVFRPSKFAAGFNENKDSRQRNAYIFLFTTTLLLEVALGICDRLIDASKSTDVGAGVLLYSGVIWELSWQVLLKGTIPLFIALVCVGWALSHVSGRDPDERALLRDSYPYVLLRSVIIFVLIASAAIALVVALVVVTSLFNSDHLPNYWLLILLSVLPAVAVAAAILVMTTWLVAAFIRKLRPSDAPVGSRYRILGFILGTFITLLLPIWWSMVALEAPAAKVAVSPGTKLTFDENAKTVSLHIDMRNFSGRPLKAVKRGTELQWWDDEHPIYESSFFFRERAPNGRLILELPDDEPLSGGFKPLTYSGDLKWAALYARSFTPFDFMGGPENDPTPSEMEVTKRSFQEIYHGYRKGRIDVSFDVVTDGGRSSYRAVEIPRSGLEP